MNGPKRMTQTTDHTVGLSPVEAKDLEWPMTRELLLEAGMVLWEEIDNLSREYDESQTNGAEVTPFVQALGEYRENLGTAQLRSDTMAFVEPLHIAWHIGYRLGNLAEAFDWDFTPWFVANCMTASPDGLSLKPDWKERARTHGAKADQ